MIPFFLRCVPKRSFWLKDINAGLAAEVSWLPSLYLLSLVNTKKILGDIVNFRALGRSSFSKTQDQHQNMVKLLSQCHYVWSLGRESFDRPQTTLTCSYAFEKHPHKSYVIFIQIQYVYVGVRVRERERYKCHLRLIRFSSLTFVPHFLRTTFNIYFALLSLNYLLLALQDMGMFLLSIQCHLFSQKMCTVWALLQCYPISCVQGL